MPRLDEEVDVGIVEPRLGMRDERDRDLVHARVPGERAAGELGEFAVEAARQVGAHVLQVLLHDVVVVEQPLRGGPGVGRVTLPGLPLAVGERRRHGAAGDSGTDDDDGVRGREHVPVIVAKSQAG